MNVQLSNYSVSVGEPLTVKIGDHEGLVYVFALRLQIFEIGEAGFTSMTATSAAIVGRGREIAGL